MPQKVILRLFIKGKRRPLFECEIVNDAEGIIKDLEKQLNNKENKIISFGQVCFATDEFRYFEILHK